jgi:hypothetical protein
MSVAHAAGFEQVNGNGAAAFARAGERPMAPDVAGDDVPNGTAGQVSGCTQKAEKAGSVLDIAADENAFRMRSEGMTYRQIGENLGVDGSMAHRRVKRHAMRQKMYLNEKLEEARDFELEKLRQMEQAILPDASSGDHASIKLVLRIMEMRRKLLKDVPLDSVKDLQEVPSIEDTPEMLKEVVNAESKKNGQSGAGAEAEFEPDEDYPFPTDRELTPEEEEQWWADLEESANQKELRTPNKQQSNKEQSNMERPNVEGKEGKGSGEPSVDGKAADAIFRELWTQATEAVSQKIAAKGVAPNGEAS